jgi:hypothetical protein
MGQVEADRLKGTDVLSLLSKSEIPNPNGQAWGRRGREAAGPMMLLKRARSSARAGLAEGSPAVGWGQGGNAGGKLCNYDYTIIVKDNYLDYAGGPRPFYS